MIEITEFEWDEDNISHIASHKVSPGEVEEIAFDNNPYISKGRDETRQMLGQTLSGRYLFVVYRLKRYIARVITAREMSEKEKKYYKRRGK